VYVLLLSGFEPTSTLWEPYLTSNAIGFGQGSACEEVPALLLQVQNFATHGMAGAGIIFFSLWLS
jgi:hypothetical protein